MLRSALATAAAFALAAAVLLSVTGTVFAQSADAPPTTPADFRATLYDKAGGELFWQRSNDDRGAVRGYEITRNGQSLGIGTRPELSRARLAPRPERFAQRAARLRMRRSSAGDVSASA